MDRVSLCSLLWEDHMLIGSAITGLLVEALRKVHATVGVLLLPIDGICQSGEELIDPKTAS